MDGAEERTSQIREGRQKQAEGDMRKGDAAGRSSGARMSEEGGEGVRIVSRFCGCGTAECLEKGMTRDVGTVELEDGKTERAGWNSRGGRTQEMGKTFLKKRVQPRF